MQFEQTTLCLNANGLNLNRQLHVNYSPMQGGSQQRLKFMYTDSFHLKEFSFFDKIN